MKKFLSLFLVFSLLLCGCDKSNKKAASQISEQSEINVSQEDPQQVIEGAKEVYSWFAMVPLEFDYNKVKKIADQDWYKIKDENYDTYDKMDKHLRTIFSDEIVNELWKSDVYKDIDGNLYGIDAGKGVNIFIEDVKYDVSSISDKKIVYTATVTYSKDSGQVQNPKTFEFVRENIDDRWVFTSFPFFW